MLGTCQIPLNLVQKKLIAFPVKRFQMTQAKNKYKINIFTILMETYTRLMIT